MKHKHKAWADGAKIEYNCLGGWVDSDKPRWHEENEYRIKPEKKQPVVRWLWAYKHNKWWQIASLFMTDEEVQKFPDPSNYIKLEYTRAEFSE